jgi:hypothetical protein
LFPQHPLIRRKHARKRRAVVGRVQLYVVPNIISYISPEQRVPQDHPLRSLGAMTDEAFTAAATSAQQLVREDWVVLDSAGEVVASAPAASVESTQTGPAV